MKSLINLGDGVSITKVPATVSRNLRVAYVRVAPHFQATSFTLKLRVVLMATIKRRSRPWQGVHQLIGARGPLNQTQDLAAAPPQGVNPLANRNP